MALNMYGKKALLILPNKDYDVSETAVPWKVLTEAGVELDIATEDGQPGQCDPLLLDGVIFGQLGAGPKPREYYMEMVKSPEFNNPKKFPELDFQNYDCVILPGGHAQGMKPYLESKVLQQKLVPFINNESKITAAICHGVLVLSRAIDPQTGKSVLFKRKTTTLPKYLERNAYLVTGWKLGKYYRTYDKYVEDEVCEALENPKTQYDAGIYNFFGSLDKKYASVVTDGNYITARFPGDALLFANTILQKLKDQKY